MPRIVLLASAIGAAVATGVCMLVGPIPGHPGGWAQPALALLAGSSGVFLALVGWRLHRHARLTRQLVARALPIRRHGIEVHELDGLDAAFVAGVRQPRIFWGANLGARLSPDEVRAVLHHERYHQLDRAPVKLVALQAIAPLLRCVPAGRNWIARRTADLEIAADRYALAAGVSRRSLARALLALAPSPTAIGVGFASAAELRLRALLEPQAEAAHDGWLGWLLAPPLIAAICLLVVF